MTVLRNLFTRFILGISLLSCTHALAGIINFDDYFVDESNNLAWLSLAISSPYTVDEISKQMRVEDTVFYGWRFASLIETQNVLTNIGLPLVYGEFVGEGSFIDEVTYATLLFGNTVNLSTDYYQEGFLGFVSSHINADEFITLGAWSLLSENAIEQNKTVITGIEFLPLSASYQSDHISPWIGSYLVRDAVSVGEPNSVILLSLSVILLMLSLKHQNNRVILLGYKV